jgi:uncharacterized protein involved in exopolysaccharide biosynthesis
MTRRLVANTTAILVKGTDIIRVTVKSADAALAARIANGYGAALENYYLSQSTSRDSAAKSFLEKKVEELKAKLDSSERQLVEQRRRIGLSVEGQDSSGRTLTLLTNRLVDAKAQLEFARIQRQQVRSAVGNQSESAVSFAEETSGGLPLSVSGLKYVGTAYEYLPLVDTNEVVQRRKEQVQEAKRKIEELDNRYGRRHPRVIDAESNLSTLTRELDRQIGNVISGIESQYDVALSQVRSWRQTFVGSNPANLKRVPAQRP